MELDLDQLENLLIMFKSYDNEDVELASSILEEVDLTNHHYNTLYSLYRGVTNIRYDITESNQKLPLRKKIHDLKVKIRNLLDNCKIWKD